MATRRGPRFSATREPGNDQKIRQSIGIGCQAAAGAGLVRGTMGGNRECYRASAVFTKPIESIVILRDNTPMKCKRNSDGRAIDHHSLQVMRQQAI
ncbi:hypothetical protein E0E54_20700, partial [Azotobacter chroococcum]